MLLRVLSIDVVVKTYQQKKMAQLCSEVISRTTTDIAADVNETVLKRNQEKTE